VSNVTRDIGSAIPESVLWNIRRAVRPAAGINVEPRGV
jgi:hypothetical protein